MYESVEVAEVRVCDLVLPPVEHVLHALVSTVDGLAQDEDGSEADHEYSLLGKVFKMNGIFYYSFSLILWGFAFHSIPRT